jgi:hypothetical protein
VIYEGAIDSKATPNKHLDINKSGYLEVAAEYPFRVSEWVTLYFNLVFSAAGYSMDVPEEAATTFAKCATGFEGEIANRIEKYYGNQGI